MAKSNKNKDNPILAYFHSTRAELRKVQWPTLEQGWSMTKVVLAVTAAMAVFLGVLDFFFGWLLGQIILGSAVHMILGAIVSAALIVSLYLIGQAEDI